MAAWQQPSSGSGGGGGCGQQKRSVGTSVEDDEVADVYEALMLIPKTLLLKLDRDPTDGHIRCYYRTPFEAQLRATVKEACEEIEADRRLCIDYIEYVLVSRQ